MKKQKVLELSLDIETDGPLPFRHSISSLGVCTVCGTYKFYRELQPVSDRFDPEYVSVQRLDREYLKRTGVFPREAMEDYEKWIEGLGPSDCITILYKSGLNFDGYFVDAYCQEFLGHIRRDVRWIELGSYAMGRLGVAHRGELPRLPWCPILGGEYPKHHALGDALQQAKQFRDLRDGAL